MKIDNFYVGQTAEFTKKITDSDVREFANISGDFNYIHLDDERAMDTIFKGRIVHGILVAGLISKVIGTQLPGEGSIYLSQEVKFLKPVRVEDSVKAVVTITDINKEKSIVILHTECFIDDNIKVIDGEAKVKVI